MSQKTYSRKELSIMVVTLKRQLAMSTALHAHELQFLQKLFQSHATLSAHAPATVSSYRYLPNGTTDEIFDRPVSDFPVPKIETLFGSTFNALRIQDLVRYD